MSVTDPKRRTAAQHGQMHACPNIIDIRRSFKDTSLVDDISRSLHKAEATEKELPTLLLYDEAGLKLFEDITYLDEYYLTNEELALLHEHANSIAKNIPDGAILCELGSGNLRKVNILLHAIEKQAKQVDYYALDVNLQELQRTLGQVPQYQYVHCYGLLGTYDDGLEWLKMPQISSMFKIILSLGSSIGNFPRKDAASFLRGFAEALHDNGCILIGIDGCLEGDKVYTAYNDARGVTHEFTLNGLKHANKLLGCPEFDMDLWSAIGRYDEAGRRHQAFVVSKHDTSVLGVAIHAGEMIRIEESHKYSPGDLSRLWRKAHVEQLHSWANGRGDYAMYLVAKKKFALPLRPEQYVPEPVPTLAEWQSLWQLWDTVSRHMIPDEELLGKPIKLRNACIFYLGHIPTFFDMKFTEATQEKPTEPKYFYDIFERGIDPDVDNPEQCHAHSEIPDEWPPLSDILAYQRRVRERIRSLYGKGAEHDPKAGRSIWLGYEHESHHLETLLYMLLQSEKMLPPTGVSIPIWSVQAEKAEKSAVPNQWINVPAADITINMDDLENGDPTPRHFGWDVEKPSRKIHVPAIVAKARPITIGEYAHYCFEAGIKAIPASWVEHPTRVAMSSSHAAEKADGTRKPAVSGFMPIIPQTYLDNKYVRTVFGAVPLVDTLTWPVSASYNELAGCAQYMGGRIPTFEEARSIYAYAEQTARSSKHAVEQRLGRTIPAVNSHLINNGVPESPPSNGPQNGSVDSSLSPHELFADLRGCNVGFQNWHPTPVVQHGDRLCGLAEMGGVWEWTSSALKQQPGFEPMPLYPAFSADFYDGKHNIVLGGSWATIPRVAGRKSFINWYQRNYPYVWAGARLVKDA